MKYLDKIGYEIEGLWENDYMDLEEKYGGSFTTDGSIEIDDDGCEMEYRSIPRKSMLLIKRDLKRIGRYFIRGNDSCGFHIHISCKDKTMISLLASRHFFKYFVDEIEKKFPVMYGNRKNNSYCNASVISKKQAIRKFLLQDSSKYQAVNFCSYREHNTIEFRIFDMNTLPTILKYIRATKVITETYLDEMLKKHSVITKIIKEPITKKEFYV